MSRHRLVTLAMLLGTVLLSALPSMSAAQTNAEFFEQVVTGEVSAPLLAGPFDSTLEQTSGQLTAFRAGVDVRNFVAHAAFTNPVADDVPWDYGFQFRTTGDNEDLRIFIVSDGTWNLSVGTDSPEQSVVAPNLDLTPGGVNTLDLIVEEFQAIFGINGEFVGVVALPELEDPTGDIYASTGFFSDIVVPGRAIELRDFAIYDVPGEAAAEETEQVSGADVPPRPVTLHAGTCDDLGDEVEALREATYPVGEFAGQPGAVVAETSFTRVPRLLGDLLAEPFAIRVAESFDAPDETIACGDVGGIVDEIGGYVIGLPEMNGSGYRGVAYLAGEDDLGRTNISVFLIPGPPAAEPQDEVVAIPETVPTAATPPAATPGAIQISDILAVGTPAATPVAPLLP